MGNAEKRIYEINQVGEELFLKNFSNSIQYIQKKYIESNYREIITKQFEHMVQMANLKSKQDVSYFGVSYLRSSLYDKSYELLFSLLDQRFYFDTEPIECYVCIPFLFQQFEMDMKEVLSVVERKIFRIQEFEEQELIKRCALYYYAIMYKLFRELSKEIKEKIIFFYGEYHGEAIQWRNE